MKQSNKRLRNTYWEHKAKKKKERYYLAVPLINLAVLISRMRWLVLLVTGQWTHQWTSWSGHTSGHPGHFSANLYQTESHYFVVPRFSKKWTVLSLTLHVLYTILHICTWDLLHVQRHFKSSLLLTTNSVEDLKLSIYF